MSSNNPTTIRDEVWNALTLNEKELMIRYQQRFPGATLQNYDIFSISILAEVQKHFELSNPTNEELTAEQQSLQQEVIAIRRDLLRLTGQTVQELQVTVNTALDIQRRVEQQEATLQLELDLSTEIAAAQAEILRRLQSAQQLQQQQQQQQQQQLQQQQQQLQQQQQQQQEQEQLEDELEEPEEELHPVSEFSINPLPDIVPPLDTRVSLQQYLELRDSNNIRYTIPYIIDEVVNEYRLAEFLSQPVPRFYNTVNTFVEQYIAQNFRNNDESQLNDNERSIVNQNRIRVNNVNSIIRDLPRTTNYQVEGTWAETQNVNLSGVPYPQLSSFTQASVLLLQQGLNVNLRTETTYSRSWNAVRRRYYYKPRYTAYIEDFIREANAEAQVLIDQNNELIAQSHIRTPLRIQLDKQIKEQNELLERTDLTQAVYDNIIIELDQTTALLRKLGEVNLQFEQAKILELTTDFRVLADKLDDTISEGQDDILEGLNNIGNFFASPILNLGQVLTSLLDPSAAGIEESLVRMTEAQENYSRRRQTPGNTAGGI